MEGRRKVVKGDWYTNLILTLIAIILLGLFPRAGKIQRIIEKGEVDVVNEVDVCITAVGDPLVPLPFSLGRKEVRGSVPVVIER